jgi:AcrR family transcriptional regulator
VAPETKRLTADDWAAAALEMIGERGITGVAVEPLAVRLGATKGSFYWHFANRDALVEAALALWERERTEAVIVAMDAEPDPARRLHRLFAAVSSGRGDAVEANLLAAADHPAVAPVMRRVVERRLAYVAEIFRRLGCSDVEARQRSLFAYTAFAGSTTITTRLPGVLPRPGAGLTAYIDTAVALLSIAPPAVRIGGDGTDESLEA